MPSGGKRPGAGRPRKPLVSRLQEGIGAVSHKKPKVLEFPEKIKNKNQNNQKLIKKSKSDEKSKPTLLPTFLEMASKEGGDNLPTAAQIYTQTLDWVIGTGCERYVPRQLIEDFAFTRRNYLESEWMNKKLGRVIQGGKASPYVKSSLEYLKATTTLYREISAIIAQNATTEYGGGNKTNAFLEMLTNRGF
ncbi:hypothetical protein FACS1894202_02050 [Clostridia bacterium]|nr:hypothetical protein FACS1894202_02050 [Clostridia bacterium]